jgi:hypothetical protein
MPNIIYSPWAYTSEQDSMPRSGWSAHPVIKTTAKRVFASVNGHTIALDRATLKHDGCATRKAWSGGDEEYYTEAGMRAAGGDPADAKLES